jgi:hypothetical protein
VDDQNNKSDIVLASIPACHAGDRGSIPRVGVLLFGQPIHTLSSWSGQLIDLVVSNKIL